MTLIDRWRARRSRTAVACRDEYGHRGVIIPVPRSGLCGVVLKTPLGTLALTPLEVGQLRAALRDKLLESENLASSSASEDGATR